MVNWGFRWIGAWKSGILWCLKLRSEIANYWEIILCKPVWEFHAVLIINDEQLHVSKKF